MQGIGAHRLGLVVLQGEQVGRWPALDQGLRVEPGLATLAPGVLVQDLQHAILQQGTDHRLQHPGMDLGGAQAQGVRHQPQLALVEQRAIQRLLEPAPEPIQAPLGQQVLHQVTDVAQEVLPVHFVLQPLVADLAVPLGLAAGIDHLDQAIADQFIQIPLHGPPPGGLGTGAIAVGHQVQQLGNDQALPVGGARTGQLALQAVQAVNTGGEGRAHGPSLPHPSDRVGLTPVV